MKKESKALLFFGIFNTISVVSFLILLYVCSWLLTMLKSDVLLVFSLSLLFFSPISCILGMVEGIRSREKAYGRACVVLSAIGLLIYIGVMSYMLRGWMDV